MSSSSVNHAATATEIRSVLLTLWPDRFEPGEVQDDVSLGEDGLGLDSVEIAEFVLECEERCGREAGDDLLAELPLTIERLARYFSAPRG